MNHKTVIITGGGRGIGFGISTAFAKEDAVRDVIAKTVETYGKIDVLINNAQASKSGVLFADHTKEDFDLAIMSSLYATFFYMREAFPYLKNQKGL